MEDRTNIVYQQLQACLRIYLFHTRASAYSRSIRTLYAGWTVKIGARACVQVRYNSPQPIVKITGDPPPVEFQLQLCLLAVVDPLLATAPRLEAAFHLVAGLLSTNFSLADLLPADALVDVPTANLPTANLPSVELLLADTPAGTPADAPTVDALTADSSTARIPTA